MTKELKKAMDECVRDMEQIYVDNSDRVLFWSEYADGVEESIYSGTITESNLPMLVHGCYFDKERSSDVCRVYDTPDGTTIIIQEVR